MKAFFLITLVTLATLFGYTQTYNMGVDGNVSTCAGTFYDPQGTSDYNDINGTISQTFCSGSGDRIQFDFVAFVTKESNDNLSIYDGSDNSATLIGTYSQSNSPGLIISTNAGNCLTFEWTTDNNGDGLLGWEATISCVAPTCSDGVLNQDETGIDCGGVCTPCSAGVDCSAAITLEVSVDPGSCENMESGVSDPNSPSGIAGNCANTDYDDDIWYEFTPTNDSMTIALRNIGGNSGPPNYYTTYIEIFSGSCGSLSSVACDENAYQTLNMETNLTGLTVNNTYYARIWSQHTGGFHTTFDMCLYEPAPTATNTTCSDAMPFCSGTTYVFDPTTGETAEAGPDYSCLTTQPNPVWYYIKIETGGDIEIEMTAEDDIDFICWGPFDNLTCNSSDFQSANEVDCNYSSSGTEVCHITDANGGAAVQDKVYVFMITNYADVQQTIYFEQSAGSGVTDCAIIEDPLPVELASFKVKNGNNNNIIYWTTSSEINNSFFIIERSNDAVNWVTISEIQGAGNSNTTKSYSYSDYTYEKQINYYRIKQVDYDGNSEIFNVAAIDNTINANTSKKVIEIIDLMGRTVNEDYKGIKIYRYEDGTVLKKMSPLR